MGHAKPRAPRHEAARFCLARAPRGGAADTAVPAFGEAFACACAVVLAAGARTVFVRREAAVAAICVDGFGGFGGVDGFDGFDAFDGFDGF
ncbi:hypothetical protein ISG26_06555, partial [Burkholderia pseudomallei]|nr:hypothetical protein [Burkholderia pseudomallei]